MSINEITYEKVDAIVKAGNLLCGSCWCTNGCERRCMVSRIVEAEIMKLYEKEYCDEHNKE